MKTRSRFTSSRSAIRRGRNKVAGQESPGRITIGELLDRYETIFFDAYGVLVHHNGALPGAAALIERLNREGRAYFVVTNDASRLPETAADRYRSFGLAIPSDRVITSGALLSPYFGHGLAGADCAVLGPEDSRRYVEMAGGRVISADGDFSVLVIGDETGFDFIPTMNAVLTGLFRRLEADQPVRMVLPNPDLIFPRGDGAFGFAAGSLAGMIEGALALRHPDHPAARFDRLGKPHGAIFEEARRRAGNGPCVMIGDQAETDIRGANRAGIDSVLITTGVSVAGAAGADPALQPTFRMDSLEAD